MSQGKKAEFDCRGTFSFLSKILLLEITAFRHQSRVSAGVEISLNQGIV
jgi:hypothetical protein